MARLVLTIFPFRQKFVVLKTDLLIASFTLFLALGFVLKLNIFFIFCRFCLADLNSFKERLFSGRILELDQGLSGQIVDFEKETRRWLVSPNCNETNNVDITMCAHYVVEKKFRGNKRKSYESFT